MRKSCSDITAALGLLFELTINPIENPIFSGMNNSDVVIVKNKVTHMAYKSVLLIHRK